MPLDLRVLQKIAELAGGSASAGDRLKQVLDAARKALGLDGLSLVVSGLPGAAVRGWHSRGVGRRVSSSAVEKQALAAIGDGLKPIRRGRRLIVPIGAANGCRAALVGEGVPDGNTEQELCGSVSSYIQVLLENERLSRALEASNVLAKRHMEEVAAIYEIGQATDSAELRPLLDMIVGKASAVMQAQTCSLMLRDPRDGALVIEASYGLSDDIVGGARIAVGEGIAGRVAATGEPMLITDVARDPRFKRKVAARAGVAASMCVPLKDQAGSVRGVLSIRRHAPNPPFTEDDLKLFGVFATHAALAISNAELNSSLGRKVQEMSTISDVLRSINSTLELDHVLDQIAEGITDVVGFDRCCVYLHDSRTGEFVASARRGFGANEKVKERVRFDEAIIRLAAKEQIPIFSHGSDVGVHAAESSSEFLAAPIVVREETIGVVVVDNSVRKRPIEPQHVELLATFVSQAGIAVENARLYEAMEEKYAELNVLYEQSRSISAASGLDAAADTLVQTAARGVRCDGAALLLLDSRRGRLKLQASCGGLTRVEDGIEKAAQEHHSVQFVRGLRNPVLLPSDHPQRTQGPNVMLFDALAAGSANLMLAPLVAEDTTVGVLALYRNKSEEFQGAEFKLVSIVASHAATVLKNALSYEQKMRQRVLELTALYEFSKRISAAASLEEALDSILAIVADLVDCDEAYIYAIDHEREVATVKAARCRGKSETAAHDEALDGGSVTSWAIKERKALVSPDISRDSRFRELSAGKGRVRSLMSIPLIVQDEVVGVLNVYSYSPNQYSEDDVRVLSIIASQGAAIYKELEALTALTSYTDNILSSIAAGVATLDSDGVVITWNSAAERIAGLRAQKVVGLRYEEVLERLAVADENKESMRRIISGVFGSGETYQGYKLSFHPTRRDEVYINMSVSQLINSAGDQLGLVIIFEDVTREMKMEDEFRRMGELAAVGQLAASIAHELRNPLSSIKGAAQYLQKEYEDHSAIVEFLSIIIDEVNGLNKLTTEFLDFARPMQLELKSTSLNAVIDRTLQLMSVHITDSNVVVKENLGKSIPPIEADEKQLEQVLRNIVINALQAMPDGGVMTVETGPASGGAFVTVSDTGVGIPEDKIDRIFLPFVTTKTKGTGLGLSVVHKIIENHGGRIEVRSQVGKGTSFRITLPQNGAHSNGTSPADDALDRRMSGELRSADTAG